MYKLTSEGKEYLEKGLPEKNLLLKIRDGRVLISDLSDMPKVSIAVGWARRNGWIRIENNSLELTESGREMLNKKSDLERALENLNRNSDADEESIRILLSRNLVEETKDIKVVEKKVGFLEKIFSRKAEKREEISNEIAQLTPELIITGKWKDMKFKRYDVHAPAPKIYAGKKQPYKQFIDGIKTKLISLGFQEMKGPLIETQFWNFDALFMPQDHPGRGIHDALYIKDPAQGDLPDLNTVSKVKATQEGGWVTGSSGWGGTWSEYEAKRLVLRSQTTSVSARTLLEYGDTPGKYFCIDRVFRHDVIDAKHLIDFDQCEGIVVGENLNFRNLLGLLKEFANMLGVKDVRFKPVFFPFTEPSCELFLKHPELGWIEAGGAGMFRPEVLKPLGINNSQVLAWGLGIGRLAMIKLGIDDIRQLYSEDLEFLRNSKLVR